MNIKIDLETLLQIMKDFLSIVEINILEEGHRACRQKRFADRIKTILLLNKGYSFAEIEKILLLDDSSLRRYYEEYKVNGIDVLIEDNYKGGTSYLTFTQKEELSSHLLTHTYLTAKEIVNYVKQKYQTSYSIDGMTALLHMLGFVYKKAKQLPGKADKEKQEAFVAQYEELKNNKNPEDNIYFMDGCHPHHNSIPAFGWIKKGTDKELPTNTGRERLNLNGAYNIENQQVVIREDKSINADSTIALFEQLSGRQQLGLIYIIADNARYYRSKKVGEYLKDNTRIKLIFLPAYSPNLNIIERLWLFFKKKLLYNTYYADYKSFRRICMIFFENLDKYRDELKSLMVDNFHIIKPKFSQTCFG